MGLDGGTNLETYLGTENIVLSGRLLRGVLGGNQLNMKVEGGGR